MTVNFAPFETKVSESVLFHVVEEADKTYGFEVLPKRLPGPRAVWKDSNYYLIDYIGKQIALRRTLPLDVQEKYF